MPSPKQPLCRLVVALGALTLACSPSEEASVAKQSPAPTVPTPSVEYAGSQACTGCHPEQGALWRGSHHDLAMQVPSPDTVLGDFDSAVFDHYGVRSSFSREGDRYIIRTEGPDGGLHEYDVAYTFGADPLQQYLIALPGGRLQALSLAWDTRPQSAGGQRWFHLDPDEPIPPGDVLHWTRRAHTWNSMCAECHSSGVDRGYDLATQTWETTWSELNIGCEACHGPGRGHLEWAATATPAAGEGAERRGFTFELPKPAVFRFRDDHPSAPAKHAIAERVLGIGESDTDPPSRVEVEVCAACHSRRARIVERSAVGGAFHDGFELSLIREGLYHPDGQPQDEVYVYGSFLQSKMFAAGVTCGHCHDPHSLAIEEPDALCSQCHRSNVFAAQTHHGHPAGSEGASCVACHMPTTTYMGVDARRDHGFRVPRPDLSLTLGTPNACADCHANRGTRWAADAIATWRKDATSPQPHFGEALYAGWLGLPGAFEALAALASDSEEPAIARASALEILGRFPSPELIPILQTSLRDPDPLVRSAAATASESLPHEEIVRLVTPRLEDAVRSVRLAAARSLAEVPPELHPPSARGALGSAFNEYHSAQLANAERPEAHVNLGSLLTRMGAGREARGAYQKALEVGPEFIPTAVNLADLLRRMENEAEAEQVLRSALRRAPQNPELHHALGLLLIRTGKRPEARSELARAAELAPTDSRILYTHGVALEDAGRRAEALVSYQRAHRAHRGNAEVLLALVNAARGEGQIELARKAARRLAILHPNEPALARLLSDLGVDDAPGSPQE